MQLAKNTIKNNCNYLATCKKLTPILACNYSAVHQMFTSRLFSYTFGIQEGLIMDNWSATE